MHDENAESLAIVDPYQAGFRNLLTVCLLFLYKSLTCHMHLLRTM